MTQQTLASICSDINDPCEVYQLLNRAYMERMLGESVSSYKVGNTQTNFTLPGAAMLKVARDEAAASCRAVGGNIPGGRKTFCIEFGYHACAGVPGCGCGSC